MGSNKLVSIVTACFNSENYISETINSVLEQTYHNWELLLVDDGSTDNTIGIISKFQKKDPRIKLIQLHKNSGAAVARNKAIERAQGQFVAFLDSDDKWLPQKLEKQIHFMLANGYKLTHTAYEWIDANGKPLNKIIKPQTVLTYNDLLFSNKIGCLTAIYSQKELGKVYMPLLRKRQDYGLWLKILKTGVEAYAMPEVLAQYRKTASSISNNKLNLLAWNWKLLRKTQGLPFFKSVYYLAWQVISRLKK